MKIDKKNSSLRSTSVLAKRSDTFVVAMALLVCLQAVPGVSFQVQTLDRVLAVVEGYIIMQSDVRAFLDLRLVNVDSMAESEEEMLEYLIKRRLMLDEVDRLAVASPPVEKIAERYEVVRSQFATEAMFMQALLRVGFTTDALQQVLSDDAKLEAYLEGRFTLVRSVSEVELQEYYTEHRTDFTDDGRQMTFTEAQPMVQKRLSDNLRVVTIADWIDRLIRRSQIIRVPLPQP